MFSKNVFLKHIIAFFDFDDYLFCLFWCCLPSLYYRSWREGREREWNQEEVKKLSKSVFSKRFLSSISLSLKQTKMCAIKQHQCLLSLLCFKFTVIFFFWVTIKNVRWFCFMLLAEWHVGGDAILVSPLQSNGVRTSSALKIETTGYGEGKDTLHHVLQ